MQADAAPTISLQELMGKQRAVEQGSTDLESRLLFPCCHATPEERADVERHVRRCFECPVTAEPLSHESRAELLRTVLDELYPDREHEPLGPPLEPAVAVATALADVESALIECQHELSEPMRSDASPARASEDVRWRGRQRALNLLASRLRARLLELGIGVSSADSAGSAGSADSAGSAAAPAGASGGSALRTSSKLGASVRRAFSFERKPATRTQSLDRATATRTRSWSFDRKRRPPPTTAPPSPDAARGGGRGGGDDDEATVGSARTSDGKRVGRTLSFTRSLSFTRRRAPLEPPPAGPTATAAAAHAGGSGSGSVASDGASSSSLPSSSSPSSSSLRSRTKAAMLRAAAARHHATDPPKPLAARSLATSLDGPPAAAAPPASLAAAAAALPSTTAPVVASSSGGGGGEGAMEVSPISAAAQQPLARPPMAANLRHACRLHEVLLFALIGAWQRRAIAAIYGGLPIPPDAPTPYPIADDGALLLRGGASGWLVDELSARLCCAPLSRALGPLTLGS